jgi:hypothetical protein
MGSWCSARTGMYFFLIGTAVLFVSAAFSCAETFSKDRFINPEICGDCHTDIYSQWQQSMHNLSHKDPVYTGVATFFLKGLTDAGEIAESESCVKCHTPVGNVTGYPLKTSDDLSKVAGIAAQGIQCDYCHSATGAKKMENNGLVLDPGHGEDDPGIKRGPFRDSESDFHETAFSEFHTGSEICGTCHNVSHVSFGTRLETTYDEWKNGPYNGDDPAKRVTCQGCHMYQRSDVPATGSTGRPANKGLAADDGPERDHVFTHVFVGGSAVIPETFGSKDKAVMAVARLHNSAELSLDIRQIKTGKLGIFIKNSGAGHKLPTGLTDVRQMWLEVVITDSRNKTVFASGVLDASGYMPDDAILYHTVFGNGKGQPVVNISKAREVLVDNRILPGESRREEVTFKPVKSDTLTISVKLCYRSAPQKILDTVFGKGKQVLPVVTMEHVKSTLTL